MNERCLKWTAVIVMSFSLSARLWAQCESPQYGWTRSFGATEGEQGYGLTVCADGGAAVTGRFGSSGNPKGYAVDFDPTDGEDVHTSQGGIDVFVTKLNADGSYAWTRTIGGPGDQEGNDISSGGDGNLVVVGTFYSEVDFDPTDGVDVHVSNGGIDFFATKLSADGSYGWTWANGGRRRVGCSEGCRGRRRW